MNYKTQNEIDYEMQNWMNTTMETAEETILQNKANYYIHPPNREFINIMEDKYKQSMTLYYWARDHRDMIKNIHSLLKNESIKMHD